MTQRRVSVFIDGANFNYLVLRKLGAEPGYFDFSRFVESIISGDGVLAHKKFYLGTVSEKNSLIFGISSLLEGELLTKLDSEGFTIFTSPMRRRLMRIKIDERVRDYQRLNALGVYVIKYNQLREKGVDVKIALDMVMGAYQDEYDDAYLISSDTDLISAVGIVRDFFGKRVVYIGFRISDPDGFDHTVPTRALVYSCNQYKIIEASGINRFIRGRVGD